MEPCTILTYPDPLLRRPAAAVEVFDDGLRVRIARLAATLEASGGIGLSAPQVGDPARISISKVGDGSAAPRVFVNPRIVERARWGVVEESCLSVPGIAGNVFRATRIRVAAQDETGAAFSCDLADMDAVCLQHEVDHLDGRLFIDRLWPLRRLQLHLGPLARARRQAGATDGARTLGRVA